MAITSIYVFYEKHYHFLILIDWINEKYHVHKIGNKFLQKQILKSNYCLRIGKSYKKINIISEGNYYK